MSTIIKGVETNGVIVPNSPLAEGTRVEIHVADEVPSENPLLHFHGHHDPNDPLEQEFLEELARLRREDLERTLAEDALECSNSSSTRRLSEPVASAVTEARRGFVAGQCQPVTVAELIREAQS